MFLPTFCVPACSAVGFSATAELLNRHIGEAGESADQKKTQAIDLNCSMTHSPGKIEYNCRYFIMTFRKQIGEYKFGKNCFHTLQSTMSHRPLTNTSSLKIAAACGKHMYNFRVNVQYFSATIWNMYPEL